MEENNFEVKLGSARDAFNEGRHFELVAHRTDDGQDNEESWSWKLQEWVNNKLVNSSVL